MTTDLDEINYGILQELVAIAKTKNADIGSIILQAYFLGHYNSIELPNTKPKLILIKGGKNE